MCNLQVVEGIHSGPAYESTTEALLSMLLIKSDMVPAAASMEHAYEPGANARTALQGAKVEVLRSATQQEHTQQWYTQCLGAWPH
jgi:hypothetical protein